jgi:4-amino-4-deoxy-L-arabinose transferase-like glycosyltransferase
MAVILVFTTFLSIFAVFYLKDGTETGARQALLKSALVNELLALISAEVLSAYKLLAYWPLVVVWSTATLFAGGYFIIQLQKCGQPLSVELFKKKLLNGIKDLDTFDKLSLATLIAVLSINLAVALIAPPNNLDSMSYHMSRVMHWIQNASVDHYATLDVRQLSLPAGAEYQVAQFHILSGNDRFVNLVQWLSYFGCIVGVSLVSRVITEGRRGQIASALFCGTIPMAVMQSTTTQNDLTVAFWIVCGLYFMFRNERLSSYDCLWVAIAAGLAIATKPTAYFFLFPFIAYLFFRVFRTVIRRNGIKGALAVVLFFACFSIVSLSLSAPSYWRNYQTFGNVIGPDAGTRNTHIGPKSLVSNTMKNIGLNLPFSMYWKLVSFIHSDILDMDINDPALTFEGNKVLPDNEWVYLLPDEDFAGSPLHLVILGVAILGVISGFLSKAEKKHCRMLVVALGGIIGFLIYSLLIKWQVWGNRLCLPVMVICSPVAGALLARASHHLRSVIAVMFIATGIFYSLFSIKHPIVTFPGSQSAFFPTHSILTLDRDEIYFNGTFEHLKKPMFVLAERIRRDGCEVIGIKLQSPEFEYPLWALVNSHSERHVKIKHIGIDNASRLLSPEFTDDELCAIVTVNHKKIRYQKLR